ncbi:Alcohol dehydrogenase, class IV [Ruminococcaceae bacterium YRB3002]|nr:Alcohol dehydrogenase, class IV [Ruminococcaceae bacterium YRB3002]
MSGKLNFVKSTLKDGVTPQTLYIDKGAAGAIAGDLKERGSKRVLFISNKTIFDYRSVENVINKYNEAGLRTFKYQRRNIVADTRDIDAALSTYKEYNCDTIVVIGNRYDIAVAKMVAVCNTNPDKATSYEGIGNIKYDIKTLVAIEVDNTPAASMPECSFYDHESGRWYTCFSQIMLPHIVVIDSDMMMRNNSDMASFSALNALCVAIEAYLSPWAANYPDYKADAAVAIYKVFGRLNNLMADKVDGYLQTKVATGGFYAGLSTTRLGFGYTYFIMHHMQLKYNCDYGAGMGRILVGVLRELMEFYAEDIAELARSQHFCTTSLDTVSAAQSFIESVGDIYKKNMPDYQVPMMTPEDCQKIAEDTRRSLAEFGYLPRITTDRLVNILRTL